MREHHVGTNELLSVTWEAHPKFSAVGLSARPTCVVSLHSVHAALSSLPWVLGSLNHHFKG